MFLLASAALMSFVLGFVCPPFWVVTFLCIRAIVAHGRSIQAQNYEAAEAARMKNYLAWSK